MKVIKNKTVIDLSRIIAGPYATMVLADFGCRVIKIQGPEGDPTRLWGPPWHHNQSTYFLSINRNKQSLALNLKQKECRQVLYKLVAKADAVVENFIPGVTERLGIDYQTLKKYNNKLVYCSISGFGDFGSKKNYPAFDNLIQAETGFMHLTGDTLAEPYKLGFAIVDVVTSLYAANSVLAGLIHNMQTGEGIHLKTSLYECAVSALVNQGSNYLNGHVNPNRIGNRHPNLVPYGLFQTKTLPIIICVGTPKQYQHLAELLHLKDREQFKTNESRVNHRKACEDMINEALKQFDANQAIKMLQNAKIPCGRVNDLQSLFQGETIKELRMIEQINDMKFTRSPIRTDKNNMQKLTPPPKFNENGKQILAQIGLSNDEIQKIWQLNKK